MPEDPNAARREWVGLGILVVLGVGSRLAFAAAFPTLPFWDAIQLIHFAGLLQHHGLAAAGWYWAQFNSGLPMILAVLFRLVPEDPIVVARTATAVVTGLVPVIPFLTWRGVLALRWRLVAGLLLALWPGQIFFSGVVVQDNWVMIPMVALGSLAARRLLGGCNGRPVIAGLVFACAVAMRQEMLVVLLPVVLASAVESGPGRKRSLLLLGLVVSLSLLGLCAQRYVATGRFSLSTEHGALGLFGSFMPGASGPGWIDARAYASELAPDAPKKLFGDQRTLARLTWEELQRRPGFHALRIAAWLPRLSVNADADSLLWSVGYERSQAPERRARATTFARRGASLLRLELAALQGVFVMVVALGLKRRNYPILILASAVLLKFLVHMIVSPLGRLVIPAIALELLVVSLGLAELARSPARQRLVSAAGAMAICLLLVFGEPLLTRLVTSHDSEPQTSTSTGKPSPGDPATPGAKPSALR